MLSLLLLSQVHCFYKLLLKMFPVLIVLAGITLSIHQGRPGHGYRPFHPRSIARRISRAR